MTKTKVFTSKSGLELIIKHRKSAVIFEMNKEQMTKEYKVLFQFEANEFVQLLNYIEIISNESWADLTAKEANSLGAEYFEYYDKELDNNGYLSLRENGLSLERPFLTSNRLYQFNKRKMESFLYDVKKANSVERAI